MTEEVQSQTAEPVTTESKEPQTLMDMGDPAPVENTANASAPTDVAAEPTGAEWLWADGVNGSGDKPEWLKERYTSVSEQAKAYGELEKRMGEFKGAPKDGYDFEGMEGLGKDDPLIAHFSETFKDMNLSQAGFERITTEFMEMQRGEAQASVEAEMKKLGPDAKGIISQTTQWIEGKFQPEVADTVKSWMLTAKDINAVAALMSSEPKSAIPSYDQSVQQSPHESVKEILNEKASNWTRYKEDENYRNGIKKRHLAADRRESSLKR